MPPVAPPPVPTARPRRAVIAAVLAGALAAVAGPGRAAADEPTAAAAPCDAAASAVTDGALTRASILLAGCAAVDAARAADLGRALDRAAADRGFSPVEIVSRPPGATITVDAAPELPFTAPRSIWLAPGAHDVTVLVDGTPVAATTVRARDGDRAVALLEVPAAAAVTAGDGDATVDFADEAAGEVHTGGPEDVAFGSLLPERYRQALDGRVAWTDEARRGPGRRHRVGLGVAVGRADGVAALGVLLDGEVGFALRRGRAALWLAPSAAIALLEAPRAVGASDDGGRVVQVHGAVAAQLSYALTRRLVTTVGAGPAAAWIAGPTRRDGAQLGALAAVGLAYRGVALHLRAEVPAVSSADVSTATLGAALGLRW